jgi:hypothetical protein
LGLTVPGAVGNDSSPRLLWRECEEALCGAGELALAAAPSSGDLNMGEMDE